jgi:hypothetical protein
MPLLADTTQHLVLDLNQIAGVEEFLSKQFVADILRPWIERAALAKRLNLGIGSFGHGLL